MVSFACCATAKQNTATYEEGKDYTRVDSAIRNKSDVTHLLQINPGKTQVLIFFSYGCHACATFDPYFEKWLRNLGKGKAIIYRFPIAFDDEWEPLAKMYYTMKTMDPSLSLNAKVFNAIHKDKMHLWEEPEMEEFFEKNGYKADTFEKIYDSQNVEQQAEFAQKISLSYGITQTPTIIVNTPTASYRINSVATNPERSLKVLSYLISKKGSKS